MLWLDVCFHCCHGDLAVLYAHVVNEIRHDFQIRRRTHVIHVHDTDVHLCIRSISSWTPVVNVSDWWLD